jgi:two-component system NtrC family sensor kinase
MVGSMVSDGASTAGVAQAESLSSLTRRLLLRANQGVRRSEFVRETLALVLEFAGCDAVELWASDGPLWYRAEFTIRPLEEFEFVRRSRAAPGHWGVGPVRPGRGDDERLCELVFNGSTRFTSGFCRVGEGLWTNDTRQPIVMASSPAHPAGEVLMADPRYGSVALLPFPISTNDRALLQLKALARGQLDGNEVEVYRGLTQTLGMVIADRRAQAALRERVKELTCLHRISKAAERPDTDLEHFLEETVEFIPEAFLLSEMAAAKISLGTKTYLSPGYQESPCGLVTDICLGGAVQGAIQVVYRGESPELGDGHFLSEERHLLATIANQVALVIERKKAEEEKRRLHEQLRHADRLVTVGQLTAGVAHELNEPLTSILGFAQLVMKSAELPVQARLDLGRVVEGSLYAREIVRKLLYFSRQMSSSKSAVELNGLVGKALALLEYKLANQDIAVVTTLVPDPPVVLVDPSQFVQVIVNLIVNASQAMPEGGRLALTTAIEAGGILLVVEDSGTGIAEEHLEKIFLPFFTTKGVGEGCGLGLSVVHGILEDHGCTIQVTSEVGRGTRIEIRIPGAGAPASGETTE